MTRQLNLLALVLFAACAPEAGTLVLHTAATDTVLFVDGRPGGAAAEGREVAVVAGSHVVELRRGASVVASSTVEVPSGARVDVSLGAMEAEVPVPSIEAPAPAAPTARGTVRITSTPPAAVRIDGRAVGVTPLEVELALGEHALVLEADGYSTYSTTIAVEPGARELAVSLEATSTSRTLTPEQIQAVVRRAASSMRRCFEPEAATLPSVRLQVQLTVRPSGEPEDVEVSESTPPAPRLRACIRRAASELRFPVAIEETSVSFPLVFAGG